MKKSLFVIVLLSLFVTGCNSEKAQTLQAFWEEANIENVESIVIVDGSTGESKTMSDPEQIEVFLSSIQDVQFTPQKNQEPRAGWRYNITLMDEDEQFQFETREIDGIYYDTSTDLSPIVEEYFKQL